ncbi:MAG: patatin-like phospholipase family protein [Clostridia bacterium]|nr:patatin-like phospholipase family protein [Clostridia bacterium]MBN2883330.1 patatin-like phospholipase family protein [Clostridia bacterium]
MTSEKYAIALAGGGTKGSYQIGVWKALRELGVEISAVAGTSIGAINGAAIALNEYERTKKLWEHLDPSYLVEYKPIEKEWSFQKKYENIVEQLKDITKKRGLDITPLRKMLESVIKEDVIRNSSIELIVSTISLSKLRPIYMSVKDMPQGQVINYILASAALPIFQRIKIEGNTYLDGGAYDNLPINALLERGYKNIIAVDMSGGLGIKQRVKKNDANIIYIRNTSMLGGLLEFDAKQARINLRLGYLDAMKAFGKNYGKTYFLTKSDVEKYTYPLTHDEMRYIFDQVGNGKRDSEINKMMIKRLLKNLREYTNNSLNPANAVMAAAEIAAETFEIDRVREYSCEALVKKIIKTHKKVMSGFLPETHQIDRLRLRLSKHLVKGDEFPGPLLLMTMPKLFITNIFIYLMRKRMK